MWSRRVSGVQWQGSLRDRALGHQGPTQDCYAVVQLINLNTQEKRDKLWCVCNRPGREVGVLLLLLHHHHHHLILSLVSDHPFSPPDWHLTALRHRRHHRLSHARAQCRLRQGGRCQHQGHPAGGAPACGGHPGRMCLKI